MGLPQTVFATLAEVICASCGMRFWTDQAWLQDKRETGKGFHCPNGHSLSYHETEADKLRKQLAAKDAELARERARIEDRDRIIERRDRSLSAVRGQVTKIKNRVQHGVCPCCNRTFGNLGRHMATKHPDWKAQEIG